MDSVSVKWIVFVLASAGMVYLSRGALARRHSHGFPRIFAWEGTLALVLINSAAWFSDPFSLRQLVSWVLLSASLPLVIGGTYLLIVRGKPTRQRVDVTLMDFEKTSRLVTSGLYRYVRHPLYGSIILLAWGAFLKNVNPATAVLVSMTTYAAYVTARADEAECCVYFGEEYRTYMKRSKMFVPFVY
jgi:protein-S-isoprenylcysteine O-methyltransferase Ste14